MNAVRKNRGGLWLMIIQCVTAAFSAAAQGDTTPPTAPSGLVATAVSASRINLSWTASTDASGIGGYKIYRGGNLLATTTGTGTTWSNVGLPSNTTYSYAVAAYDASSNHNASAQSGAAIATTPNPGYSAWPNGPSPTNNPNFFPIGVWLQSPENVAEFRNIGINMFLGFYGALDQTSLTTYATTGMPLVPDQNSVGLSGTGNSIIKGWDQIDEPDNAQPNGSGGYGPCIPPGTVISNYNVLKANDSTRPVELNFGRGASDINYVGRGVCGGDTNYYVQACAAGDILSFDIYPVSDDNGRLEEVPNGVDNLKTWSGNQKIIWNFIEAANQIGSGAPTGPQVKAEVWMSIIHGSRGILYFVHQLSPVFREDGIFNYPTLAAAVSNINAQITSLAPVLNSPTIDSGVQVTSSVTTVPVDAMVKQYAGDTYVFAAAMRNNSTTATFTLPGAANGTVTVLGESRQLTLTNGVFSDAFVGYGVHLYQTSTVTRPAPPTNLHIVPQ